MKKFTAFQKDGETWLKEVNPQLHYGQSRPICDLFEQSSLSNAKPLIGNFPVKDEYCESDLRVVFQFKTPSGRWHNADMKYWNRYSYKNYVEYWSTGDITAITREAYEYIGEIKAEIITIDGKKFPMKEIRKQNGLKHDIIKLVLNLAAPDDDCMLSDFLMALQFVLDKHQFDERARIIDLIEAEIIRMSDHKSNSGHCRVLANLITKIKQS